MDRSAFVSSLLLRFGFRFPSLSRGVSLTPALCQRGDQRSLMPRPQLTQPGYSAVAGRDGRSQQAGDMTFSAYLHRHSLAQSGFRYRCPRRSAQALALVCCRVARHWTGGRGQITLHTGQMRRGKAMTEAEWLSHHKFDEIYAVVAKSKRCSQRVKSLLAAAICRRLDPLYPSPLCSEAIDLVERIADGKVFLGELTVMREAIHALFAGVPATTPTEGEWEGMPHVEIVPTEAIGVICWLTEEDTEQVFGRPEDVCGLVAARRAGVMPTHAPYDVIDSYWYSEEFRAGKAAEEVVTCALLRDLFGNPFRPVTINPSWLAWNDGTVVKMAQSIYNDRAFDRLPILADALEEASCTNPDLLNHCRQPGPHVRGCWVVDMLLGKE